MSMKESLKRMALLTAGSMLVAVVLGVAVNRTIKVLGEAPYEETVDDLMPPPRQPALAPKREFSSDSRSFNDLTPKNQAFVRENYKALLSAQERKDFQTMLERARNILSLVDEYNDTRSYENIAKRGLDAMAEEQRRRQFEQRQAEVRNQVQLLEGAGREVFALGFSDVRNRDAMARVIAEIFIKDPNNHQAAEWRRLMFQSASEESRHKVRRELASLEIKGQGLVKKAKKNVEARAELYRVIDGIHALDPANSYPVEWKKSLLKD